MRRLIFSVFTLLSIMGWLSYTTYNLWRDPNTLPVKSVQVEGEFRYVSKDAIEKSVIPFVENGFLHVDVAALRTKLLENSAIKDVHIVRVWPEKVWIDVVEHKYIARWQSLMPSQSLLITDESRIVELAPNLADQSLPLLIAPGTQIARLLQTMKQIDKKLEGLDLHVTELTLDQRQALNAKLDNDIQLFLGKEGTLSRVQRFAEVYKQLTPKISGKINYIDLRYTNGIAVKIEN